MKTMHLAALAFAAALAIVAAGGPLGTSFTYQGQLKSIGQPFSGAADLTFVLFDASTGGNALGTQTFSGVKVTNGLFTVQPDFGSTVFDGNPRWLEISVNGQTLSPRQAITATPYASYAAASPGSTFWVNGTNSGDIA